LSIGCGGGKLKRGLCAEVAAGHIELLRRVRSSERWAHLPFLLATADAAKANILEAPPSEQGPVLAHTRLGRDDAAHRRGQSGRQKNSEGPPVKSIASRLGLAAAMLMAFAPTEAQQRLTPPMPDLTGIISTATTDGKTGLEWAIVLGKALFWDQQAGSDGVACASCHFNAGADNRITNQLSPGVNDITKGPAGDTGFGSTRADTGGVLPGAMPSGATALPNYALKDTDFPLHRLVDERSRNSDIVTTTNDIVSSQGAFAAPFVSVGASNGRENCGTASADIFHAGGFAARQVALRNSGTTINAIFNRRTLWNGSANNLFNGVGSSGMRDIAGDANKRLIVLNGSSQPELGFVQLPNASLASQAVGPIVNSVEMSCAGRKLSDVGRKLMATAIRPLQRQTVDPADSVLAGLIDGTGNGLAATHNYATLVKRAFDPKFWNATGRFTVTGGQLQTVTGRAGYTQIEHNWSLFWGLSILLYESTLISNVSEFDALVTNGTLTIRDIRTGPPFDCTANGTVDPLLLRGCQMFFRARDPATNPPGAGCNACHGGKDVFTNASHQPGQNNAPMVVLGTVLQPGPPPGMSDLGFQNTGIRPVFTDRKIGGDDPYGNPLSYARQYLNYLKGLAAGETQEQAFQNHIFDPDLKADIEANNIFVQFNGTATTSTKLNIEGASKSPTLRNVALTPPYTSSGMFSNLRQVLKFYNRETNRRDITAAGDLDAMGTACNGGDNAGSGADGNRSFDELTQTAQTCHTNILVGIGTINLLDCDVAGSGCDPATDDLAALIRFLKSLTDPRVQCDAAPFDHPALALTVGHRTVDRNGDGRADDIVFQLPAAGAAGYDPATGYCIPNAGNLFEPGMQGRVGGTRVPLAP